MNAGLAFFCPWRAGRAHREAIERPLGAGSWFRVSGFQGLGFRALRAFRVLRVERVWRVERVVEGLEGLEGFEGLGL